MGNESSSEFVKTYCSCSLIGNGSFGIVVKAKNTVNGKDCALKILDADNATATAEIQAVEMEHHPNVLECRRKWEEFTSASEVISELLNRRFEPRIPVRFVAIEMELCYGSLEDVLVEVNDEYRLMCRIGSIRLVKQDLEPIFKFALDIISGLSHLHSVHSHVHRDLKPANILYDSKHWKIGDFGLARFIDCSMSPGVGNRMYAAPEISTSQYDHKVDIFSFGLILFEMVHPFNGVSEKSNTFQSIRSNPNLLRCDGSSEWFNLIANLIDSDVAKRPASVDICRILHDNSSSLKTSPFIPKTFKLITNSAIHDCGLAYGSNYCVSMMEALRLREENDARQFDRGFHAQMNSSKYLKMIQTTPSSR